MVAERGKPIVGVPSIVKPVQVQVTFVRVAVQIRHIAIAVRVLPHGTNVQNAICTTTP